MLVLKRRGRTRLQTGMVEFIALPFQSEKKKLEIWSFHVVVVQGAGCRVQGAGCRVQGAELLFCRKRVKNVQRRAARLILKLPFRCDVTY